MPVPHDILEQALDGLLRRRGMLDHGDQAPGLGASLSESLALRYLAGSAAPTQQELGTFLDLEKSTVSRLVTGMIDKGWVTKGRDLTDRRSRRVTLTPAGGEAAERIVGAMRERHARWLANLSPHEVQALTVGITALVRVISDDLGHPVNGGSPAADHGSPSSPATPDHQAETRATRAGTRSAAITE